MTVYLQGQSAGAEALKSGLSFIESSCYTEAEDLDLLALYEKVKRCLFFRPDATDGHIVQPLADD